jgi:hypothetical protein
MRLGGVGVTFEEGVVVFGLVMMGAPVVGVAGAAVFDVDNFLCGFGFGGHRSSIIR